MIVAGFALDPLVAPGSADPHGLNPQRPEHVLLDVVFVVLPRDGLDHSPQQTIPEIRVRVPLVRLEIQRLTQHPADDLIRFGRRTAAQRVGDAQRLKHRIERTVAVPAASMLQQLPDRDGAAARVLLPAVR